MKASEDQVSGNHYKKYAIQPAEFIQKNGLNWCEGNAIKYLVRHRDKKGAEDLRKAKHYIDLLLEWEYSTPLPTGEGSDPLVKDATAESLCHTCHRNKGCIGDYPRERDGGCEGYIKADKENLCASCSISTCTDGAISQCKDYGYCTNYAPTLRERILDAKQEAAICPQADCTCEEIGECACVAKQEAPTAAEQPAPHTDPSTNCQDCGNTLCVGIGRNLTCDQGCERFTPKETEELTTVPVLPSMAIDCTANEAWAKYQEERKEVEKAADVLHSLIELWDCIQALQTSIEKGACGNVHLYNSLCVDMEQRRRTGLQVDLARRAMLIKNAARWRYSDEVNRLIIESNGHNFTPKEGKP